MRFFDSNVLVAAAQEDHQHFDDCIRVLTSARVERDAMTSAHALAETYSVLTRQPKPRRFSPEDAGKYLEDVATFLDIRAMSPKDMVRLIADLRSRGIAGGRVYDAIHARTAVLAGADIFVTWNRKDFADLEPGLKVEAP